jgi:hypothetical protein
VLPRLLISSLFMVLAVHSARTTVGEDQLLRRQALQKRHAQGVVEVHNLAEEYMRLAVAAGQQEYQGVRGKDGLGQSQERHHGGLPGLAAAVE